MYTIGSWELTTCLALKIIVTECKFVGNVSAIALLGWTTGTGRCHVGLEAAAESTQWSELNTIYLTTHTKYSSILRDRRLL